MVGPSTTRKLRIRVIDQLYHIFGAAEDRSSFAQAAYKNYFGKTVFDNGDMVFLYRQKHEPKSVMEREEHIAKSKLLPKYNAPHRVIWAYPDVIFYDIKEAELSVSGDSCPKALDSNSTSADPNKPTNITNSAFPLPHPI